MSSAKILHEKWSHVLINCTCWIIATLKLKSYSCFLKHWESSLYPIWSLGSSRPTGRGLGGVFIIPFFFPRKFQRQGQKLNKRNLPWVGQAHDKSASTRAKLQMTQTGRETSRSLWASVPVEKMGGKPCILCNSSQDTCRKKSARSGSRVLETEGYVSESM